MALVDLIAQSGADNFEKIRRGWLPTAQEKAAEDMARLQVRAKKQAVDYEPERQKIVREKNKLNIRYKNAIIRKNESDMDRLESEQQRKELAANQETMGLHFQSANKLKSIDEKKNYLYKNRDQILLAGSQEDDDGFNSIMNLSGDKFNKAFTLMAEGNKYLQKLNEKRFGKSTSFQNFKTGKLANVMLNDVNYQQKVDSYLSQDYTITNKPKMNLEGTPAQLGLKKDKVLNREIINEETAIRSANFIGKRTIETLMNSPESLATTGAFSRVAASMRSQIASTAKLMGVKWEQGTDFDAGSYGEIFQKAGIDNVVIRGNLTQLARMLATASGESKVLSNADMKRWLNVIAVGNGNPKIVSAAIRNALEIQNFRFKEKYRISTKREFNGDLGMPKLENTTDLGIQIKNNESRVLGVNARLEELYKSNPNLRQQ